MHLARRELPPVLGNSSLDHERGYKEPDETFALPKKIHCKKTHEEVDVPEVVKAAVESLLRPLGSRFRAHAARLYLLWGSSCKPPMGTKSKEPSIVLSLMVHNKQAQTRST